LRQQNDNPTWQNVRTNTTNRNPLHSVIMSYGFQSPKITPKIQTVVVWALLNPILSSQQHLFVGRSKQI